MLIRSFTLAAAALAIAAGAAAQSPIPVFVNGARLSEPARLDPAGRTLLPMRLLFESLDARVAWDNAAKAVYAWTADRSGVRLATGARTAQLMEMSADPAPGNWGRITGTRRLDAPARLIGGRVYIPVRFAAESLNAQVRYDTRPRAVHVRTAGGTQPPPPDDAPPPAGDLDRRTRLELLVPDERIDIGATKRVTFSLVLTNLGSRPLRLNFNTGQQFNFEVLQEGRVFWSWADDRSFTQALTSIELGAGEKKTFTARWDLKTKAGRTVRPGRYTVRGIIPASEGELRAERRLVLK